MKTNIKILLFILLINSFFGIINYVNASGNCDYESKNGYKIHIEEYCSDIPIYFDPNSESTLEEFLDFFKNANERYDHTVESDYMTNDERGMTSSCGGYIKTPICIEKTYIYDDWGTCTNSSQSRTVTEYSEMKPYGTCNSETEPADTQSCDSTAPTGAVSYSPGGWTNGNVKVTIICSDNDSGCKMNNISGWSKSGNKYYKTFSSNTSGSITLKDKVGNTRSVSYNVNKIDKVDPICGTWTEEAGWGRDRDMTLSNSTDSKSGINIGGGICTVTTKDGTCDIEISDKAGNKITCTSPAAIKIDKIKPTVTDDYNYNGIWKKLSSVEIILNPNDLGGSSLKETKWCVGSSCDLNNGNKGVNIKVNADNDIIIRYQAWDNAGNNSDIGSIYVKLDNSAALIPTISSDTNVNENWSKNNDPYFKIKDGIGGPSPIKTFFCLDSDNNCNPDNEGNEKQFINVSDGVHYFRAKSCDTGGCSSIVNYKIKIDNNTPTINDISKINPENNSYIPASEKVNIKLNVDENGGSPISQIEYYYEIKDSNNYSSKKIEDSGNIDIDVNFQNVDNDIVIGKNYRDYSFKVTKICDEAGNCTDDDNFKKIYNFHVYANMIDKNQSSISSIYNLNDGSKIADGTSNLVKLILKDKYGNKILPVLSDGDFVGRNVDVNINYTNNLYLNQYKQEGLSAVYIGDVNLKGTDTPNEGIFRNSNNGIYDLNFKVYSPTTNAYEKTNGTFKVNKITAEVSDITGITLFASDIEFKFKPIYDLKFKDIGAKKYGFVEGTIQNGEIIKIKNGDSVTSSGSIYLEFGKYESGTGNVENTDFNLKLNSQYIKEGYQTDISDLNEYNLISTFGFTTLLEQENTSVVSYNLTYLASFIKYNIDGKTIAYPTDIIGKMTYSTGTGTNTNEIKGVKILGKTYSKNAQSIFQNQELDYNDISGNLNKTELKKKIRKKAYNLINNIDIDYYTEKNNNYRELLNNNVIYYKLNGGKIKYSNIDDNYKSKNGKTVLIIGGDLIIQKDDLKSNILIHGIVVLKDLKGNGGNILVDDDVLNINSVMYADKALLAYNLIRDKYLTLDDGIGYFKNQLYIKGSLFSNNTLGGSRGDNKKCAYYDTETCDKKNAQKFDLNFIRRYSRYDSDGNGELDTISELGSGSLNIPDKYLDYPLIIEYNPLIQITPPPLFSN